MSASTGLNRIPPAIAPSTGVPPNSFAVFQPTRIARYAKTVPPIKSKICIHVCVASTPAFFAKFAPPLMIPEATRPGMSGMKMFPIRRKKRLNGDCCFAFTFCRSTAARSSGVKFGSTDSSPIASPVSRLKWSATRLTVPGPTTICNVSSSMTPMTPSIRFNASISACVGSFSDKRTRVIQCASCRRLSFPPTCSSIAPS